MSKNFWLPVIISLGILFSLNLLMISSLAPQLLVKQIISWAIGLVLFFIGTQINPRQIVSSKTFIFIISCLALIFPIIVNNFTRGSRRWIDFAGVSFQPSELVKPWLMLFLVNTNFPFLILIPVAIILIQPDLGSAISVLLLLSPLVLYSPKILKTSLLIGLILVVLSPLIWKFALQEYQRHRILNFIDPQSDPLGKGYNVIQSKIAIGSGGILGKGYRKGSQGQLLFLPEKHTDFMFAATAEELGLTGSFLIIFSYFLLIKTLFDKAFTLKQDRQLFLFTLGIAIQIWAQAFINIGMNLGLLPVTGIPLPFLSVGGSSIMALMFSLGIVFSS
jgi:rod shape determining protein RodA